MARSQDDQDLRRMVLRLRDLASSDFDAVMDALNPHQKEVVFDLLQALDPAPDRSLPVPDVHIPLNVSAWLAARINGRGLHGEESADQFVLTPRAHLQLRQSSKALMSVCEDRKPSVSLLDCLWRKPL